MKIKNAIVLFGILFFVTNFMFAQQATKQKPTVQVLTVKETTEYDTTYYGARIEPKTSTIQITPFAGKIQRLFVKEGDKINVQNPLYVISKNIQTAVGDYVPFTVYAEMAGVITKIAYEQGDDVRDAADIITIADIASLKAVIYVSDKDIPLMKIGMTCSIPSMNDLAGRITKIAIVPEAKSGLFPVEIEFKNDTALFPGKFVTILLPVKPVKGMFVPADAVISRYGKKFVYTVTNGKAQMLEVQVIEFKGTTTLVTGIPDEQEIVVSNMRLLTPDAEVTAVKIQSAEQIKTPNNQRR